jgi:hypothetical protein
MTIQNSELDFFEIKSQLKTYLKKQPEFFDYDFNGSGLSNILDVLAHNTHINGLIANMAINESFLSSAQLRSSVVSHAEALGYLPKSMTSSTAIVSLSITNHPSGPDIINLPVGTEFTTSVEETQYTFTNPEYCTALKDGDNYVFKTSSGSTDIFLKEGRVKNKTFIVGDVSDDSVYVIPDESIDTSTIVVDVYENYLSLVPTTYTDINKVSTINDESRVFIIRETSNGYYEIFFSDGSILGQSPTAGNKIEITYIASSGEVANGGKKFSSVFTSSGKTLEVTTIASSAGGSEKESSASIKLNAPRSYSAQNRLVTADDYTAMIQSLYGSYFKDVVAWGGNDNLPPEYGVVFVSINFEDGTVESIKDLTKTMIRDQLTSNLSIMSIDTKFVEPERTYLELQTKFNIDTTKDTSSVELLQNTVNDFVVEYTENNLNEFGSIFRRSNVLTQLDNISPAILNSRMDVRIQQRIDVDGIVAQIEADQASVGIELDDFVEKDYTINFPVLLASPDKDDYVITTSGFSSSGVDCVVKNELGSTRLQLLDLNNVVRIANVGDYDPAKGLVNFRGLVIDKNSYSGDGIKVTATPANQSTISPLRNYIITLDQEKTITRGVVDAGANKVVL